MLTHNTHYPSSQVKSRHYFASAFPVPSHWCLASDLKKVTSFYCHDDCGNSFRVHVCFYDGSYFFYRQVFMFASGLGMRFITSCSFVSLRNCLIGFRTTARALQWHVNSSVKK